MAVNLMVSTAMKLMRKGDTAVTLMIRNVENEDDDEETLGDKMEDEP
jgi:hypothetical protein